MEQLGPLVIKVVGLRTNLAVFLDTVRDLRAAWDAENADVLAALKRTQDELVSAEDELRIEAVAIYSNTGNKQIAPGVVVRVNTELRYDEDLALAWAKAHDVALTLDRKMFEKIAKVTPPPFVKTVLISQATLAKNLEAPATEEAA